MSTEWFCNYRPLIGQIFFEATVSTSGYKSFMMLFTSVLNFMFQNTSKILLWSVLGLTGSFALLIITKQRHTNSQGPSITKKNDYLFFQANPCFCFHFFHVVVLLLLANSNNKRIVILYTISVCYGLTLQILKRVWNYSCPDVRPISELDQCLYDTAFSRFRELRRDFKSLCRLK
jgi:hypothetical protein